MNQEPSTARGATIHPIEEVETLFRVPIALALSVLATGCATGVNRDLPKCDGAARAVFDRVESLGVFAATAF